MEENKATEATASGMAEDSKITPTYRERDRNRSFFCLFLAHLQSPFGTFSEPLREGISCRHNRCIPAGFLRP